MPTASVREKREREKDAPTAVNSKLGIGHSGASIISAIETKFVKLLASCQTAIHTLPYHISFACRFLNCEAHLAKSEGTRSDNKLGVSKNLKLFSKLQCHAIHVNPACPACENNNKGEKKQTREESKVFTRRQNNIRYNS